MAKAKPAAMAGRANGNATRKMRRTKPAPNKRAASINCGARSANALRQSKYTYGYKLKLNTTAAPQVLRTSGHKAPCQPVCDRNQVCSGPLYCKKSV
jgi:hypothetical protein